MTNSSSRAVNFFSPFVIVFACVSWAKISGTEDGEVDDGDNT
jgi:hypothetical protein